MSEPGGSDPWSGVLPMRLLAAGVPLTLLLDLMSPHGPDSAAIMRAEAA